MATQANKLAEALEVLHTLQEKGVVAIKSIKTIGIYHQSNPF